MNSIQQVLCFLSFYFFIFVALNQVLAQNYQIKARVIATKEQGLDYLNISIFSESDSLIFGKTFLEQNILVSNLPLENLNLKISHLEKEDLQIKIKKEDFLINSTVDLGTLVLKDKTLQSIEISAWQEKKPLITQNIDKTIVNVENQPLLQNSNDLFELFRKTPRLQVDAQDKVSILGLGVTVILVNGKKVPETSLYGIAPSQVKSIEILDQASGKIQAIAGSSKVINVVTITPISNSWYLNSSIFGSGLQNNWQAGLQTQAGLQWEKLTFNIYYNYKANGYYNFNKNVWRNNEEVFLWNQNNSHNLTLNNHSYGLQIDYSLTKYQDLSLKYSGNYFENQIRDHYQDQDGFEKKMSQNKVNFSQQFDSDYRLVLDTLGSSWDIHFQFLEQNNTNSEPIWTLIKPDPQETIPYLFSEKKTQHAFNTATNYEYFFKILAESHQLIYSTGLSYQYEESLLKIINSEQNKNGIYASHIENLYNTLRYKYKQWIYEISLIISAYYFNLEQEKKQKNLEWNYSPNFKFHYLINESFQFISGYNYSFNRPYIESLLSYSAYDPNTYWISNSDLKTSKSHNFYGNFTLWKSLQLNLNYNYILDHQTFSSQSQEDYQILTFKNINQHNFSVGVGYYYQYKFWTMNYYTSLLYWVQEKNQNALNSKTSPNFYFYTTQQFSLPKNFSIDISYFYRHKMTSPTIHMNASQNINLGVQKKFAKIPLSISINYQDIGNLSGKYQVFLPETGQQIFLNYYNSNIQLRLRYNFGQSLIPKNLSDQKINSRLGGGGGGF